MTIDTRASEERIGGGPGRPLRAVAVFCGSRHGHDPTFGLAAESFGRELAARGLRTVYGGGSVGLMGVVADAALAAGGEVAGVIPRFLADRELEHRGVTELHLVDSMHERKAIMAELSDAFVALPGGIGTLEELFEVWTWGQLGLHVKPCGVLNVGGYFDRLLDFLDQMVGAGFLHAAHRGLLHAAADPAELLDRLVAAPPPPEPRWAGLART
jgi:uncharacterized protein (TIGR00730 family)